MISTDNILKVDLCHSAGIFIDIGNILKVALYHLVSILTNTNDMLNVDFCHLASTLISTDDLWKVASCYLASILLNINDKADNFIKKRSTAFNQLFISCHLVIIEDNSFISQQVNNPEIIT